MFIDPATPALVLAPMEGVFDAPMRALLAETGGFDFAVSEFVRVSSTALTASDILRVAPELSGVRLGKAMLPVQVQLLGSNPTLLADTAIEACIAGARAIDLNFGCPSPTVIRHHGGAALLRNPEQIRRIVSEVRQKLPSAIPVSAKIRLGWEQPDEVHAIASAVCDGGANWIVIHARTRAELYHPGVHWDSLAEVKRSIPIPVIANGDLFSLDDVENCRLVTGCHHFMIGRGALLDPFLASRLAAKLGLTLPPPVLPHPNPSYPIQGLLLAMQRFIEIAEPHAQNSGYVPCRVKQWMKTIRGLENNHLLSAARKIRSTAELLEMLRSEMLFNPAR